MWGSRTGPGLSVRWLPHRLLSGTSDHFIIVLVALTLVRGIAYALLNPPFASPDEGSHLQYIAFLAAGGTGEPGQEGSQPVLYYALLAPVYRLMGDSTPAIHLLAVRMASLLFLLGILCLAWRTARWLDPRNPGLAIGVASIIAFNPESTSIAASANNDNAANLFGAILALLTCQMLLRPQHWTAMLLLVVSGLALLTKGNIFSAVFVGLAACTLHVARSQVGVVAKGLSWMLLLAFPVGFVLQVRPGVDPIDAPRSLMMTMPSKWPALLSSVITTGREPFVYQFRTFWASFIGDSVRVASFWYVVLAIVILLSAFGHLRWAYKRVVLRCAPVGRRELVLLAFAVACALQLATSLIYYMGFLGSISMGLLGSTVGWDPIFRRPEVFLQGRYLFPVLVPFSVLLMDGLQKLWAGCWERWLPLAVIGMMMALDFSSLLALISTYAWPVPDAW